MEPIGLTQDTTRPVTGDGLQTLAVEVRDGVVEVTLDRPERLNALSGRMFAELAELAGRLEADPAARVVLLTGRGRGFCAGLDLLEAAAIPDASPQTFMRGQESGAAVIARWRELPLPVVAAVNGPAAGGGLALALAADVRFAAPTATFNVAMVRLGLSGCDVGISWMLPRVVGLGHAADMMLTGRQVGAREALGMGLVNRVVEADELLDEARGYAQLLLANSPFGLRLTKQTLQQNVDAPSLQAAISAENRNQALAAQTSDSREAIQAFLEKRPARFRNR